MSFQQALQKVTQLQYGGAAQAKARTFEGMVSNIQDVASLNFMRPIGQNAFTSAKGVMGGLNDAMTGQGPGAEQFQQTLSKVVSAVNDAVSKIIYEIKKIKNNFDIYFKEPLKEIISSLARIGTVFGQAFGKVTGTALKAVADALVAVLEPLAKIAEKAPVLIQMFAAMKALQMMGMNRMANPLERVTTGINPLSGGFGPRNVLGGVKDAAAMAPFALAAYGGYKLLEGKQASDALRDSFSSYGTQGTDAANALIDRYSGFSGIFDESSTKMKKLGAQASTSLQSSGLNYDERRKLIERVDYPLAEAENAGFGQDFQKMFLTSLAGVAKERGFYQTATDAPKMLQDQIQTIQQLYPGLDKDEMEKKQKEIATDASTFAETIRKLNTPFEDLVQTSAVLSKQFREMGPLPNKVLEGKTFLGTVQTPQEVEEQLALQSKAPTVEALKALKKKGTLDEFLDEMGPMQSNFLRQDVSKYRAPGGSAEEDSMRPGERSSIKELLTIGKEQALGLRDAFDRQNELAQETFGSLPSGYNKYSLPYAMPAYLREFGGQDPAVDMSKLTTRQGIAEEFMRQSKLGLETLPEEIDKANAEYAKMNVVMRRLQMTQEGLSFEQQNYTHDVIVPAQRALEDYSRVMLKTSRAMEDAAYKIGRAQFGMSKYTDGFVEGTNAVNDHLHELDMYQKQLQYLQLQQRGMMQDLSLTTVTRGFSSVIKPVMGFGLERAMEQANIRRQMAELEGNNLRELSNGQRVGDFMYELEKAARTGYKGVEYNSKNAIKAVKEYAGTITEQIFKQEELTKTQHQQTLVYRGLDDALYAANVGARRFADAQDKLRRETFKANLELMKQGLYIDQLTDLRAQVLQQAEGLGYALDASALDPTSKQLKKLVELLADSENIALPDISKGKPGGPPGGNEILPLVAKAYSDVLRPLFNGDLIKKLVSVGSNSFNTGLAPAQRVIGAPANAAFNALGIEGSGDRLFLSTAAGGLVGAGLGRGFDLRARNVERLTEASAYETRGLQRASMGPRFMRGRLRGGITGLALGATVGLASKDNLDDVMKAIIAAGIVSYIVNAVTGTVGLAALRGSASLIAPVIRRVPGLSARGVRGMARVGLAFDRAAGTRITSNDELRREAEDLERRLRNLDLREVTGKQIFDAYKKTPAATGSRPSDIYNPRYIPRMAGGTIGGAVASLAGGAISPVLSLPGAFIGNYIGYELTKYIGQWFKNVKPEDSTALRRAAGRFAEGLRRGSAPGLVNPATRVTGEVLETGLGRAGAALGARSASARRLFSAAAERTRLAAIGERLGARGIARGVVRGLTRGTLLTPIFAAPGIMEDMRYRNRQTAGQITTPVDDLKRTGDVITQLLANTLPGILARTFGAPITRQERADQAQRDKIANILLETPKLQATYAKGAIPAPKERGLAAPFQAISSVLQRGGEIAQGSEQGFQQRLKLEEALDQATERLRQARRAGQTKESQEKLREFVKEGRDQLKLAEDLFKQQRTREELYQRGMEKVRKGANTNNTKLVEEGYKDIAKATKTKLSEIRKYVKRTGAETGAQYAQALNTAFGKDLPKENQRIIDSIVKNARTALSDGTRLGRGNAQLTSSVIKGISDAAGIDKQEVSSMLRGKTVDEQLRNLRRGLEAKEATGGLNPKSSSAADAIKEDPPTDTSKSKYKKIQDKAVDHVTAMEGIFREYRRGQLTREDNFLNKSLERVTKHYAEDTDRKKAHMDTLKLVEKRGNVKIVTENRGLFDGINANIDSFKQENGITEGAAHGGLIGANPYKVGPGYPIRVAEEGYPEMIIPLAPHRRERAKMLVNQTKSMIGFANGGHTSGHCGEGCDCARCRQKQAIKGFANGGFTGPFGSGAAFTPIANFAKSKFGLTMTSGKSNHNKMSLSGNVSDHWYGRAGDFSNGSSPTPQMDSFNQFWKKKLPQVVKQLIWRDKDQNTGYPIGGHMDHVHLAIHDALKFDSRRMAKLIDRASEGLSIRSLLRGIPTDGTAVVPEFKLKDYPPLKNKGASGKAINEVMKHIWKKLEKQINDNIYGDTGGRARELQLGQQPRKGVKYKLGASSYGFTAGDDNGMDRTGKSLFSGPLALAELGMGGAIGNALGSLPYGTKARVTYKGRSVVGTFRDVGSGGGPVNGLPRTLDIHARTARAIGFPNGLDTVTLQRFAAGGLAHARAGQGLAWAGWNAKGGEFKTTGPTLFGAGEAGPERVKITPETRALSSSRAEKSLQELVDIMRDFRKSYNEDRSQRMADRVRGPRSGGLTGREPIRGAPGLMTSAQSQRDQYKEGQRATMDRMGAEYVSGRLQEAKRARTAAQKVIRGTSKKVRRQYDRLKKGIKSATDKARGSKSAGGKKITKAERRKIDAAKRELNRKLKKSSSMKTLDTATRTLGQANQTIKQFTPLQGKTTTELGGMAARAAKQAREAEKKVAALRKKAGKKVSKEERKKIAAAKKEAARLKKRVAPLQDVFNTAFSDFEDYATGEGVAGEIIDELYDESDDEDAGGLQSDTDYETLNDSPALLDTNLAGEGTQGRGSKSSVPQGLRKKTRKSRPRPRNSNASAAVNRARNATRPPEPRTYKASTTKKSGTKALLRAMKGVEDAVKQQKQPQVTVQTQATGAKIQTKVKQATRRGR